MAVMGPPYNSQTTTFTPGTDPDNLRLFLTALIPDSSLLPLEWFFPVKPARIIPYALID